MGERKQVSILYLFIKAWHIERSIFFYAHILYLCSLFPSKFLPGNHITVVLQHCKHYLAPFSDILVSPCVGYQVYRFFGIPCKNNLGRVLTTYEFSCGFPALLVFFCSLFRYPVNPPVNVRIIHLIELNKRIDNLFWFLRSGSIIKICQILPVEFYLEDREIVTNGFDVDH